MTFLSHRVTAVASALVASLAALVVAPAMASVSGSPASSPAAVRSEALAMGFYGKCKYFQGDSTAHNYELCLKVLDRYSANFSSAYKDSVVNRTGQKITGTCTAQESQTFEWGGSISASAKGKAWIFAEVSVSVEAHFSKSMTSGFVTSAQFTVKPHSTKYCDRGIYSERFLTRQCFANAYTQGRKCDKKIFHAPARRAWVISNKPILG